MENGFVKIYKSVLKFLEPLSVEKTSELIVKEGVAIAGASFGSILLLEDKTFRRVYSTLPEKTLAAIKEKGVRKRGFTYQSFKKKEIIVKHKNVFGRYHPEIARLGVQTEVFIPLSYKKKAIGTLVLNFSDKKILSKNDKDLLKLLSSMASLAIRNSQLYAETNNALEIRNLFISTAAHEIRTPVTTIFGYSQLLSNLKSGKRIKNEWIDSLYGECNRLRFLVNDLLEASHINTGYIRYTFKECSLMEIIQRAKDNFNFSHTHHQLILKNMISDNDIVIGDRDRLIQVFINLFDNAAKFSPVNSSIFLTLKSDESGFVILIRDQGKGIAKKDLPNIFNRYYRGGGTKYEGLGLGLFLVKSIIEHHHGSINLKSKAGKGTTVEIKLPKRKVGAKL